jgi:hypothetical protein
MTEAVATSLKEQIDDLANNRLGKSFKLFGLGTFLTQVNQAQIVGITSPQKGLTEDEANKLRKYILDLRDKL